MTSTFLRQALPEASSGTGVLDLGVGPAGWASRWPRPRGSLWGSTAAAPAVAAGRAAAARSGLTHARIFQADAEAVNLPRVAGWEAAAGLVPEAALRETERSRSTLRFKLRRP